MLPGPDEVRAALARHERIDVPALPGRTNHLRAGVLVPLVWRPDPVVVLTLRPETLRRSAGEVSFPGGMPEPADRDFEATALREAREELGISRADVLGRLSSMPLYTSDHRLEPFVAAVPDTPLLPSPDEVADVLLEPIRGLLERESIDAIPYEQDGTVHLTPIFFPGGHLLYGATAHVLLELMAVLAPLFGRDLPPLRPGRMSWEELVAVLRKRS